jgi:hypothetical protein
MAFKTKTFEVRLDSDKTKLAFGLRMAAADYIRSEIANKLGTAEDASIDRQTAMQKFSLLWANTARGFRLPRAIPAALVQWCGFVEFNNNHEGFPKAAPHSIGAFGYDSVQELPGDVVVIKLGGIAFTGVCPQGVPGDITETRVAWTPDGYIATIVYGRADDDSAIRQPVPVEGEPEPSDA